MQRWPYQAQAPPLPSSSSSSSVSQCSRYSYSTTAGNTGTFQCSGVPLCLFPFENIVDIVPGEFHLFVYAALIAATLQLMSSGLKIAARQIQERQALPKLDAHPLTSHHHKLASTAPTLLARTRSHEKLNLHGRLCRLSFIGIVNEWCGAEHMY